MNEFASIPLPDYVCFLLRKNMSSSDHNKPYRMLTSNVFENPSLHSLFETFFLDIDPECKIDFIYKSMGWEGIRDRLINICLHYQEFGYFSLGEIDYIKRFERIEYKLKPFSIEGISRLNLLFLYIQSSLIINNGEDELFQFIQSSRVLDYLKCFKSKVIEIDYILLSLYQFEFFLGESELRKGLEYKTSYMHLYDKLDQNEKKIFIKNILAYSHSIDDDFFFDLKV